MSQEARADGDGLVAIKQVYRRALHRLVITKKVYRKVLQVMEVLVQARKLKLMSPSTTKS